MLHPGESVADRYEIVRLIGRGGMGMVYEARQRDLGLSVALKVLHEPAPHRASRFAHEARITALLRNDNVVRVLDFGHMHDERPFLVMELLQGHHLGDELSRTGPMAVDVAVDWVLEAASGVAEAHAKRITHRDLKPSNLFLSESIDGSRRLKVLDFGVARALLPDGAARVTETCAVMGTPPYMPPEQLRDARQADARSDIWSLGVILYELLSARLPFPGETATAVVAAIAADDPVPLARESDTIPEEVFRVVHRCLRKDASERFQTVGALASALAPFGSDRSVRALASIRRVASSATSAKGAGVVAEPDAWMETEGGGSTLGPMSRAAAPSTFRWTHLVGVVGGIALLISVIALAEIDRSGEPASVAASPIGERSGAPPPRPAEATPPERAFPSAVAASVSASADSVRPARSTHARSVVSSPAASSASVAGSAAPPVEAPASTTVDPMLYRK